jgi:hypothetical protein
VSNTLVFSKVVLPAVVLSMFIVSKGVRAAEVLRLLDNSNVAIPGVVAKNAASSEVDEAEVETDDSSRLVRPDETLKVLVDSRVVIAAVVASPGFSKIVKPELVDTPWVSNITRPALVARLVASSEVRLAEVSSIFDDSNIAIPAEVSLACVVVLSPVTLLKIFWLNWLWLNIISSYENKSSRLVALIVWSSWVGAKVIAVTAGAIVAPVCLPVNWLSLIGAVSRINPAVVLTPGKLGRKSIVPAEVLSEKWSSWVCPAVALNVVDSRVVNPAVVLLTSNSR